MPTFQHIATEMKKSKDKEKYLKSFQIEKTDIREQLENRRFITNSCKVTME